MTLSETETGLGVLTASCQKARIEAQAAAAPDRVAFVSDPQRLTYDELNGLEAPGVDRTERGTYLLEHQGVVRRLGLEACVPYLGTLPNARLPHLLIGARALAAPSLGEEPTRVAILERLGCRMPVVANQAGGIRSPIASGRTGPPFSPNDPPVPAAAIERSSFDLNPRGSTAGSGPRVLAGRHACCPVGEHLLPRCERVLGPHETSIG